MLQNDNLESPEVTKMNTPALERLFIEMSNASTTLINNYGYDLANGSVTNLEIAQNTSQLSNGTVNGNPSVNCSYGNMNPLDYHSHPHSHHHAHLSETTTRDNNIQQQINPSITSTAPSHTNQHMTNPVFHNDSMLTESLSGNIHRSSEYTNNVNNANNNSHNPSNTNHSLNGTNTDLATGIYQVTDHHLTNHTLAQPIASSTPLPMTPSPVTLTTLSNAPTVNRAPNVEGLMHQIAIKNDPDMMNSSNCASTNSQHNIKVRQHSEQITQPASSLTVSPPVSPIDMEEQEKVKLERKRQRNRIAASKCRKRKLEKIHLLEKRVNELKDENAQLSTKVNKLRDHVCCLKQEVIQHINSGCPIASPDHPM